jgi:predicted PurR-regulated permease PerM
MNETAPPARRSGAPPALMLALVTAALYFARDLLIPLALAILLAFLLAPAVVRLEHARLGRIPSTAIVVVAAFAVIGAIGWLTTTQVIGLVDNLPEYRVAIKAKFERLKGEPGSSMDRASQAVRELGADLGVTPPPAPAPAAPGGAARVREPVPVAEVPERPPTARETMGTIGSVLAPLFAPIATFGAVVVFTVVILLQRADLRDRLYRLAGERRISVTASAIEEAAERVSRYLRMQVLINVSYGLPIGVALYLLGIPNALLWGILAAVLRFVPYVGPWVAAAFPLTLALATGDGWTLVLWTAGVFLALELVSNNVIEPWLYGASTGLSPVAILVSALFWTWLWGIPGLLLAVPLTVCVAVIGRYIPQLGFLDVILGDTPVLAPHERLYQRLLAGDDYDADAIVARHLAEHGRVSLYGTVLMPALGLVEQDRHRDLLDEARLHTVLGAMQRLIDASGGERHDAGPPPGSERHDAATTGVLIVAAHDEADALVGRMLAGLLSERGIPVESLGEGALASEVVERVNDRAVQTVCISAVPPMAAVHAAYLCKRLRQRCPGTYIVAGLWGDPQEALRADARLKDAGADAVSSSLEDAVEALRERMLQAGVQVLPPAIPGPATPPAEPPSPRRDRTPVAAAAAAPARASPPSAPRSS